MARRSVLCHGSRAISLLYGNTLRPLHASLCSASPQPKAGFKPEKVAVVTKTTRYEFEQQRYRYAGVSEEDLKQLLAMKGSSYNGLLERHNIHTSNVEHIVKSLQREGITVQVVKRGEYNEDVVRWADSIISAGGDGTMLLVASKVFSKDKPVVGVNTDPERSEGHLCLPVRYTRAFPEALEKLCRGEFRWLWRQRIRLHLEGTGINPNPVDLHEQQLSLEQHNQAHRFTSMDNLNRTGTLHETFYKPSLLPVRSLNEIFIGESLSSRASYYEISVDDGPWEKQKSSGLNICTGTGSKAWSYNINKLAEQAVEEVLKIGTYCTCANFEVQDPQIMVVDGGTSFEFNDGAIATISMSEEDQLRTVVLEN
ncbi:NAD kinase 2, mitochondrial [Neolamprologus brichardi]|uniref:NAD kinase 2, mitochondrial n=1 Tax=Neolamprologus brichardi TaxID=32507 RepID=UPI001643D095|nr:NAD kinase 2, mitochondrial [Neolamprologus brichardi]